MNLETIEARIKELNEKKPLTQAEQFELRKLTKEKDKLISPVAASGVFVSDESSYDNSRVVYISVEKISMNPNQPRRVFDQEKLLELSESIKEHGLLQPIVVNDIDGKYVLVAGERRYRAHILAGLEQIKAIVVKGMDDLQMKELAIIENIQREDLNCIEEAMAYKQLQDTYGYSIRKLDERFNKKGRNYIHIRLKLMEFKPELIDFINEKELYNVSLLNEILKCDESKHKKLLEDMAENKLTAKLVKEQSTNNDEAPVKKEVAAVNQYPYGLKPITGVKIKSNNKKLALEIDYKDFAGKDIEKIKEYLQEIIEQSIKKGSN